MCYYTNIKVKFINCFKIFLHREDLCCKMDKLKLQSLLDEYIKNKKINASYYNENWSERKERKNFYQSYTKEKLLQMTEDEFFEYISKLWSMLIWGNKKYVVDKLIEDNGFKTLKKELAELLFGSAKIGFVFKVYKRIRTRDDKRITYIYQSR